MRAHPFLVVHGQITKHMLVFKITVLVTHNLYHASKETSCSFKLSDNRRQGRENSFGQGNRRQQNRRSGQQQQFEESQDFNFEQDGRQGRQSGDVGLALGVLNNPPREDGSYNFK